jgi:WD40 repeat protein
MSPPTTSKILVRTAVVLAVLGFCVAMFAVGWEMLVPPGSRKLKNPADVDDWEKPPIVGLPADWRDDNLSKDDFSKIDIGMPFRDVERQLKLGRPPAGFTCDLDETPKPAFAHERIERIWGNRNRYLLLYLDKANRVVGKWFFDRQFSISMMRDPEQEIVFRADDGHTYRQFLNGSAGIGLDVADIRVKSADPPPGLKLTPRKEFFTTEVISQVAFANHGTQIVSMGNLGAFVWDAKKLTQVQQLTWQPDQLVLGVSPDGTRLIACGRTSDDATSSATRLFTLAGTVWALDKGRSFKLEWYPHCIVFSPDTNLVAFGEQGTGMGTTWKGKMPETLDLYRSGGGRVAGPDNSIKGLDGLDVNALAFSPDGKVLAIATTDRREHSYLHFLDTATPGITRTVQFKNVEIASLAYSPDGKMLALGTGPLNASGHKEKQPGEYRLLVWHAGEGNAFDASSGHDWNINALAFSPSGKLIATAGDDLTIRWWEAATGKPVAVCQGHKDKITSLAISPDGKTMISGCQDGMILFWDLDKVPGAR